MVDNRLQHPKDLLLFPLVQDFTLMDNELRRNAI